MKCKICKKNSKFDILNTYKHHWFYCWKCKNIFTNIKKRKNNILLRFLVKILVLISKQQRIEKLLLYSKENRSKFYHYYKEVLENNLQGKWKTYDRKFLNYLKRNKINLKNKSILSISDEPGFISLILKKFTKDITLTALDPVVTKFMKKRFNCNVVTYDINKNKLSKRFKRKFDLVFYRSTLNFNYDFKDLISETHKISKKNAICIFNFHTPSISSCFMWMFDDYTLKSLVNENYINKLLENKFLIKKRYKSTHNPRKLYYNTLSKKFFYYPFFFYYYSLYRFNNFFKKFNLSFNPNQVFINLILKKMD
jgi:hypothetical protein